MEACILEHIGELLAVPNVMVVMLACELLRTLAKYEDAAQEISQGELTLPLEALSKLLTRNMAILNLVFDAGRRVLSGIFAERKLRFRAIFPKPSGRWLLTMWICDHAYSSVNTLSAGETWLLTAFKRGIAASPDIAGVSYPQPAGFLTESGVGLCVYLNSNTRICTSVGGSLRKSRDPDASCKEPSDPCVMIGAVPASRIQGREHCLSTLDASGGRREGVIDRCYHSHGNSRPAQQRGVWAETYQNKTDFCDPETGLSMNSIKCHYSKSKPVVPNPNNELEQRRRSVQLRLFKFNLRTLPT
ncbi:hypothetical protein B0H16DRAFT_1458038 [Mycena metata]|uniref:Uncharacterized protein n=1 Tax=Mycena metata TaxID=1033252 RepID=A0AAD7J476_9AGAR|nr:hypothetical protein B0H16DRAFT_1458038 [Mycena metata]